MKRSSQLRRRTPLKAACGTGKRRYSTEEQAEYALLSAQQFHAGSGNQRVERRAYVCHLCLGWHLTSEPTNKPTIPAQARRTGPDPTTRGIVLARDDMRCVITGDPVLNAPYSIHHRLPRGRGGTNVAANLIVLSGTGATGAHGEVESHRQIAYEYGWLLRTGDNPERVPVKYHDGWWLLDNQGGRTPYTRADTAPRGGVRNP